MGLLIMPIALVLCYIVYSRMYKREVPEPIGKKKAAIPVLLGLVAPLLSFGVVLLIGLLIQNTIGGKLADHIPNLVLKSLAASFLGAGLPEELVKFLLFLLTAKLVKPKNVYEYGLLLAGIGFGFTALEELLYGSGESPLVSLIRLPAFALHMVFGLIMGLQLGLARLCRQENRPGAGRHTLLALFLPILWHTVFDAATTTNAGFYLDSEDESNLTAITIALVLALVVIIASVTAQFVLLRLFGKKSDVLCKMEFNCERQRERD